MFKCFKNKKPADEVKQLIELKEIAHELRMKDKEHDEEISKYLTLTSLKQLQSLKPRKVDLTNSSSTLDWYIS